MDTKIYTTQPYQDEAKKTADKQAELLRLLEVKTEKIVNMILTEKYFTQLSYLSKEEQIGAIALPKGMILDKLLNYLRQL